MPNAKPIEPITCRECEFTATCWCSFEARDFKARTGLCKKCAAARDKMSASCKNKFDAKPSGTELTLKQKAAWLCALLLIGALVLSAALYPVFQQRAEAEKQRIALAAQEKVEAAKQAKISAAKAVKIKAKRKGKMVKIAMGQTGPADLNNPSGYGSVSAGQWRIGTDSNSETSIVASSDGYSGTSESGWVLTSGGVATVPVIDTPGTYYGFYGKGTEVDPGSYFHDIYEFEVVCVDGEVRIAPVSN